MGLSRTMVHCLSRTITIVQCWINQLPQMLIFSHKYSKQYWYMLRLPSLLAAWLFELFILNRIIWKQWSLMVTISPTNLFIWKKWTFVGLFAAFWSIFLRKYSSQITHANLMTMTTSGQILSCPDYRKTKENVNIMLLDLCLFTFYSVHSNKSTWHWL